MNTAKVCLLLFLLSSACYPSKEVTHEIKPALDSYLSKIIALHNIPGLALAVVQEDQVIYENYTGKASLESDEAVDVQTLFRVFSATKLISATGVFQLIQEGKLHLDDKISLHLNHLPSHWNEVEVQHLLSHSSGLPDLIWFDGALSDGALMKELSEAPMEFETGYQFSYNQTNYWLLAQIIEKISGKPFDQFVLERQFENPNSGVLFSSNSQATIPKRATRYYYNNQTKTFDQDTNNGGKRAHAGNGLNITLTQFIEWNKRLDDHILLNAETKSMMWTPFAYGNGEINFLHGWGQYSTNGLTSYGFSGGNLAAFRKFPEENTTIILLSNGYEIPAYDIIIHDIARLVIPTLSAKDLTLEGDIMAFVLSKQWEEAITTVNKLKAENPGYDCSNLKWNVNSLGNALTRDNQLQEALQVFSFNAEAFPNWWVSIAALAESLEALGELPEAVAQYKKAILLNENNEYSYNEQMQKRIDELEQ